MVALALVRVEFVEGGDKSFVDEGKLMIVRGGGEK